MYRRILINTLLVVVFLSLEAVVVLPLASEVCLRMALRSEDGRQWERAEGLYRQASFLSPFDTKHLTGYADFLLRRSVYEKDKDGLVKKALALYQRALELESYSAEHALALGQLEIKYYLEDKGRRGRKPAAGLLNLYRALENDPFGVNAAFLAGTAAMSVWEFLGPQERELFLDKLKYALTYRPWYAKSLYPRVWGAQRDFSLLQRITPENPESRQRLLDFIQKNDLWQFRKVLEKKKSEKTPRIQRIKQSAQDKAVADLISQDDWQGISENGRNVYKNGNMYWNGAIDAPIRLPEGECVLVIRAKATPAGGFWPYMTVELDGEEIGEGWVESQEWRDYALRINTDGGIKVLSIAYVNDGASKATGEDRNLFIEEARVVKNVR